MNIILSIDRDKFNILKSDGLMLSCYKNIKHFSTSQKKYLPSDICNFAKENNGITVVDNDNNFEIYNDPFRTIPLYITYNNNKLIIFSNFSEFFTFGNVDRSVDEVGFWEIILYGGCLWTRTVYKNVKQMVSASKITINKQNNKYNITKYWNFSIKEDSSIVSIDIAAEKLNFILDSIFSKIDYSRKYLMGLSGGIDSKITAAYLSKYLDKDKLKLFTFGYDENILEYKYAKSTSELLGFYSPEFYKLTARSFKYSKIDLPRETCWHIGFEHCHIYDYLKSKNYQLFDYDFISTNYSDAVFGWEARSVKDNAGIEGTSYFNLLQNFKIINNEIVDEIILDINSLYKLYDLNANYSSLNEYSYVTERNQKFHMNMTFAQSKYIKCITPYANYELLKFMISVPLRIRSDKKIIDKLFSKYFPEIVCGDSGRNISSRFQWGPSYSSGYDFYSFRAINCINSLLLLIFRGDFQIFNKYITENQLQLFYTDFKFELYAAINKIKKSGLLNDEQVEYLSKLPLRSSKVSEKYKLIGLAEMFSD